METCSLVLTFDGQILWCEHSNETSSAVLLHGIIPLTICISLPESIMETCSVVLTFESGDEILWCDHSNETSSAVLLYGAICFSVFYKMKFDIFLEF